MSKRDSRAPVFRLPDQGNTMRRLADFKGKWLVLYFYPRDNTSGCTLEAKDFSIALKSFQNLDAQIIGVSPDSVESHKKFADKHNLKITLLSDTAHTVLESFGVWQKKKMYGKEFWGVVRSTFLIDPAGRIRHEWRKVKVKGHVEEVKEQLEKLQNT